MGRTVLQVSKYYPPYVGGLEYVVERTATGLAAGGDRSRVLAAVDDGWTGRRTVDGVEVTKPRTLGAVLSQPVSPTFPVHLRRLAADADVVHYHLPNPLAVVSAAVAPRDTPTVATYHSDIVRQERAMALYEPVLRRFLDRVDAVVTTSPQVRDNSDVLAPYREKCHVVPVGVDLPALDAPEAGDGPDGRDESEAERPFTALFVGRLTYYKGVDVLLDSFDGVDGRLVVVGDGPEREPLESRAAETAAESEIRVLGEVDDATLAAWYERADVLVLPSVAPSEAFGVVQLEAMAHGVPTVNTDLPTGVPWVSVDGETGVTVPPGDAAALGDALRRLAADPEERRRLGAAARERVESRFTADAMVDSLRAIYRSVSAE